MKTLITISIAALLACSALTGCKTTKGNEAVPSSTLKIPTPQGNAEIALPKDEQVESFRYERNGTNVIVDIKGLKAANSPEVVAASWQGIVAQTQAQLAAQTARLEMLMQFVMWGGNKAGNYFGLPTTPPPSTNTLSH